MNIVRDKICPDRLTASPEIQGRRTTDGYKVDTEKSRNTKRKIMKPSSMQIKPPVQVLSLNAHTDAMRLHRRFNDNHEHVFEIVLGRNQLSKETAYL